MWIDIFLYLTYVMVSLAIILSLGFALMFLVKNFKKAKATIFGAIGILVIFFISYAISSSEVYEKFQIDASLSKIIGGTLIMLYIVFIGTILAAVYAEVAKLFK